MNHAGVRVIETDYKGYRFRSRLEARWAVFFDTLGVTWEYEREGYTLQRVPPLIMGGDVTEWAGDAEYGALDYLPDFWLPDQRCWIEIKGETPTELEQLKAARLAYATDRAVCLFFGEIPAGPAEAGYTDSAYWIDAGAYGMDTSYAWAQCGACGRIGITFTGLSDRLPCSWGNRPHGDGRPHPDVLTSAYARARAARFGALDGRGRRRG